MNARKASTEMGRGRGNYPLPLHPIPKYKTPVVYTEELTHLTPRFPGSAQQSVKVRILRGFLKSDEFGLSGCHALCFQQQVAEIAVAATTAQ